MNNIDDLISKMTEVMREADIRFETTGGGTRHFVRECLLPIMEEHNLTITVGAREADIRKI